MNNLNNLLLSLYTRFPILATFEFKDFNPNSVARTIINTLVGLLTVAGALYGGILIIMGFMSQDPKEKRDGVIALIASLVVGGMIIAVTNMMIV